MSFGGAGQGNIRYSIILDDTQAIQKIGQFKTALNGITQPSQTLATNIGTLNTNFTSISTGLTTTNTGFKTLGTGINGLAIPTRTLGTNMGVLNNNFKAFSTTETQTVTQTNAFKTGITALTTPTQQVGTNMKSLVGNMSPLAGNFQKASGAAKDMVVQQNNLSKSSTSLGDKIKSNISKYSTLAIGISTTITAGLGLFRSLRDLEDAHLGVDRAVRKQSTAQEALDKATAKVVKLEKEGKKGTVEYANALRDQTQAQQLVNIANTNAAIKQKEYNDTLQDVALNIIPTVLGGVGSFGSAIKDSGLKVSSLSGGLGKMKGFLGAVNKEFSGGLSGIKGYAATAGTLTFAIFGAIGLFEEFNKQLKITQGIISGSIKPLEGATETLDRMSSLDFSSIEQAIISIAKLTGGSKALADILKPELQHLKDVDAELKKVPPTMNKAATSTDAWVNMMIRALQSSDPKKIIEFNKAFKDSGQPVERYTEILNLATAAINSTKKAADASVPSLNKSQAAFGTLAKFWEVEGGKAAAVANSFGAGIDTLKSKFLALNATRPTFRSFSADVGLFLDLLAKGNPTAITKTVKEFANLKTLQDQVNKGAKDLQQIWEKDAAAIAIKKAADEAAKFKEIMASSDKAFKGLFKIDSNVDKIFKDLVKGLPNKVEKKLKLNLKFEQKVEDTRQAFQDFLGRATKVDEKTSEKMAQEVIDMIDKKFKGKKGAFAGLRAQLEAAIADPNTPEKLRQLLINMKVPDIPIHIIPPAQILPPIKDPVKVPSVLTTPPPLPPPKNPVQVPSVLKTPPPIPSPKTPVKVPAVLELQTNFNLASLWENAGKPPIPFPKGNPANKNLRDPNVNEFTNAGRDFQRRLDNARHAPEGEEDLGGNPPGGWGTISSGGGGRGMPTSLPVIDQTAFQKGLQLAIANANQTVQLIAAAIAKLATVKLPALDQASLFQKSLFLAIANATQTVQLIGTALQSISSIQVPPPNETKYQQGLQLAIDNSGQTVKLIGSTLKKISSIQVPPPNESKYQKGLQLAIDNAAQTVKLIKKALDKIGSIKVPAPKFNSFNSALDQAVSDTKRAVREINNALKQINKPGGGGNGKGPGATTGPFAQGGTVIANQRTTATFGEAGPELAMFVPLKGGGMRSVGSGSAGGDNVEVVNIINIMDETIMRRITARSGRNRFALGV